MASQFKFSLDDDRPDTVFKAKRESLKTDKLGQRLTISVILTFLLIGASAGGGYYYFNKKMSEMQADDARHIRHLSQDLDSKFSVLSKQFATMEGVFANIQRSITGKDSPTDEMLLEMERSVISLKDNDKKLEDAVKKLEDLFVKLEKNFDDMGGTKIGKQDLEPELNKLFDPIRAELNTAVASVKTLDQKFARELAGIASKVDVVETEFGKTKGARSPTAGVDKRTLDAALDVQQKKYQEKIDGLAKQLEEKEKEIQSIKHKLQELERANDRR